MSAKINMGKSKKSQIWGVDLAVALIIFFGAVIFFYKYGIESIDYEIQDDAALLQDDKLVSNYLSSPGFPANWSMDDATLIGLTDEQGRLDSWKVEVFYNISRDNYRQGRMLLSTSHNYYISFEDKNGTLVKINNVSGIGRDYNADNPRNLIKVVRFVFYNSSIIKMNVYAW